MSPLPSSRIAELNDLLRRNFAIMPHVVPGAFSILITPGAGSLNGSSFGSLISKIERFDAFDDANDPHGEHDFGSIEHEGKRYFWKIDYYDLARTHGSPDPSDPTVTHRMLTIMRGDEY